MTHQELAAHATHDRTEVADLLERRARIQEWLERLDAQRGTVSPRVVERVKADYEGRLRETVDALASHRATLARELKEATNRLEVAERDHGDAADALEEGRLRSAIGELNEALWAEERARLEGELRAAAEIEEAARAEDLRLRELLDQLDAREEEVEPVLSPVPEPEASIEDPDEATREASAGSEAFLADIDRALSDPADADSESLSALDPDEDGGDTAPKPGVKCGECGYTNDLGAWFCGVCGADIG